MIISKAHDFAFVHIAKCAGSTIRQQLRDKDDLGERFYRSIQHPELGRINANHLPMDILAHHFPEEFQALRSVTSYTVLREPMDRFISGVAQYIRDTGKEPGDLSPAEIATTAQGIIAYMQATPGFPDYAHALFIPQSAYLSYKGQRVVTHAFAMETLRSLFDRMEHEHGLTLIRDRVWNQTVTYKVPAMAAPLKAAKDVAQKVLPVKAYAQAREWGMQLFTTKGVPKINETLEADNQVRDFVGQFYAEDQRLHHTARTAPAP